MDFSGAISEASHERFHDLRGKRHLIGKPERAVNPQRPIDNIVVHLRHQGFDGGDVFEHFAVVFVLVDAPRRAEHKQTELLHLNPRVRDLLLHHLFIRQRFSLGLAGEHALAHHVERFLDLTHRAHGMMNTSATQTSLRHLESLTTLTKQILTRDAYVFVANVGVLAAPFVLCAEPHIAQNVDARRVRWNEKHRHFLIGRGIRIGHHHNDQERGKPGI